MAGAYDFDAIVVGSGISGGWAAKELTERGLKTLVLERGSPLEHGRDYLGEHKPVWELPERGLPLRDLYAEQYAIQQTSYAFDETTRHFWNNDADNPYDYDPDRPFEWLRAGVVGGRSTLWARQVYRWSDLDFEANHRDGHGIDWPIRYADLAPWYSHVERFIGVSGAAEGLPQLPDGEFLAPMGMNVLERHVADRIRDRFPDRVMTIGRTAVLTEPLPHSERGVCHYCGPCHRGCSVGAYFSSLSSTLPAARATGNLTLEADQVVAALDYDPDSGRVSGVQVIDAHTRTRRRVTARVVFLCASALGSTQILLNSASESFPDGLANRSGALGRYLMDHTYGAGARGLFAGFEEFYPQGSRPNGIYLARYRNLEADEGLPFRRGFGYQGGAARMDWRSMARVTPGFGAAFKNSLRQPGPWVMTLSGFGECLPDVGNRMTLHPNKVDRFGIPLVSFDFHWSSNELAIIEQIQADAREMLTAAGAAQVSTFNARKVGGSAIHEMGTARMGRDPAQSVLNGFNQAHDVPNLFVTDGAAMTSSSCVNPSITYMALTARAVDHAVELLEEQII
ncbi:MAG: GMC family oxidoreductase [Gammaproteobacteria bacterium]|nr:MAG: GMC family oxidoreductase [Gammaproteobacteria bacterium]